MSLSIAGKALLAFWTRKAHERAEHRTFREATSADILGRLLASPSTRVNGRPYNADVDLPELAEVAVNAADALIMALSRPPNEALLGGPRSKAEPRFDIL